MRLVVAILFLGCCCISFAQQNIERKVVVEDDRYYYVKIDRYLQVGTLHILDGETLPDSGKTLALPAGRNYNEPVNPFSWDLQDTMVYAVNFLDHPMNDRNEALKKFSVNSLQSWSEDIRPQDMIMKSTEHYMFTYNDPYLATVKRSNVLNNFFFDGIYWNGAYWMVVANNNELSVWKYQNEKWTNSDFIEQKISGYFSLVSHEDHLKLIANNGDVFLVKMNGLTLDVKGNKGVSLNNGVLVEDRNDGSYSFIEHSAIGHNIPLKNSIEKFAKKIL